MYEEGTTGAPVIASASLVDAAGHRARVKWVDAASHRVAGYLTGAIVIPVSPLKPFTRYTATVALAANDDVGPVRHVWSFTTGARNPGGTWATTAARPRLTRLRMSHRRFRVGSRRSAFRFHLSEPAAVRIMLARVTHRRGGAVGRLVRRRVRGGSRKIPFSGRLGSRALRPGRYRAVATAIAHGRVSAPRSVTFRIVR